MMFTLHITNEFANDLDKNISYIKKNLMNEQASLELKKLTIEEIKKIKKHPNTGSILYNINNEETFYKYVRVKKYFIFYRILNKDVYIERMIYQARDFMKIIFGNYLYQFK